MNPHTPPPDDAPNTAGRQESTTDPASSGTAGTPREAGGPGPEASPVYAPGSQNQPSAEDTPPYTPPPPAGDTPPYIPPPYTGGPPAPAQPQNFFDWIRSHGIYRGRERWIGGVASGIAQRLGVDPLIVRGILIVLTVFAGVGVLFYGLAWALLPEPDGRIHVQEAAAGRWSSGMTGALITTIIGFPSLGSGAWGWDRYGFGAFVWTVFWVGGVIWLVYYLTQRNKAGHSWSKAPAGTGGTAAGHGAPGNGGTPGNGPMDTAVLGSAAGIAGSGPVNAASLGSTSYGATGADWQQGIANSAPGWSVPRPSGATPPLGGGPTLPLGGGHGGGHSSGYAPAPPPPVPAPKPRNPGPGTPAVAVTAGLALLVGGGIKALDATQVITLGTAGSAVAWASGAAVLGLGILVTGLRGRSSGILSFFAVVALIAGGIFNAIPNADRARFQNVTWTPASIEQATEGFDITAGTGTVDLTKLDLKPPLASDVVVRLDATASNVTIAIPDTVPVQVQADLTMANLNEGRGNHGGVTNQQTNYNTDKPGSRLIVKLSGTLSNITVKEGI